MKGTTNIETYKTRVAKDGDTMSGSLTIDQKNGTTSSVNYSVLTL